MSEKEAKTKRGKKSSKYDELIHMDAHPQDVIRSLFQGKSKHKDQWRFIQEDKKRRE